MKKLLVAALAMVTAGSVCMAQEVAAEAEGFPLSFEATLDLYSDYMWRGIQVTDEPVYQPGGSMSYDMGDYGSLSAAVWANFDFTDTNGTTHGGGLNEVDYTASYAIDVADFTLEAGHIWYTFPQVNGTDWSSSTREVYGSVAYNNDIVTPSLAVYYDYAAIEGFYSSFALSKDFEIAEQVTAGVFASLGAGDADYNQGYGLTDDAAVIDGNIGANVSYAINDIFSVGATVVFTSVVDSGIRDNVDATQDKDILWGGVNLAAAF